MEKRLLYFGKFQTIQRNRLPKMGVFIAHDFFGDNDSAREGYRTMFDDAFVNTNYMPLYATGELRTILDTVAPNLINAEAGIFDVSTHRKYNANVLIELGMALGLNYPTVVVAEDDGEPLLDFLEALKPLRYHKRRDLISQLPDTLNEIVNTDQLLGESYCVICRQDTCSCRKRIHQQDKTYMLVGTHVEEDEVDIDVKASVRDLKLERLSYEDGLATNLCGWLYTMRRSRFVFFYSKPLGKSHHGAENAATMVQLGMAIGSAIPWGIIVPPGEFGPTDVSSILSIRADKNPKNFRSQLKNSAAFLLQEHNPFHGIYDPLEPPLEVPIQEDERSIDDEPPSVEAKLYGVPSLPENFVKRHDPLEKIVTGLLSEEGKFVGISGPGGSGKTTLIAAVCRDKRVQMQFPDGIIGANLEANPNPSTIIRDFIEQISGLRINENLPISAITHGLEDAIGRRSILIILDGASSLEQIQPFLVREHFNVTYLVTSRDSGLFESLTLPQIRLISLERMTEEEALELLTKDLSTKAIEPHIDRLRGLASKAGFHPFSLNLLNRQLITIHAQDGTLGEGIGYLIESLDSNLLLDDPTITINVSDALDTAIQSAKALIEANRLEGKPLGVLAISANYPSNLYGRGNDKVISAFRELIINASKYCNNEKGQLVINGTVNRYTQMIEIDFIDDSKGIAIDALEKIFQPGYRLSNEQIEGTGWGLPFARLVFRGLGGDLLAEGKGIDNGRGTTFHVRLPLVNIGNNLETPQTVTKSENEIFQDSDVIKITNLQIGVLAAIGIEDADFLMSIALKVTRLSANPTMPVFSSMGEEIPDCPPIDTSIDLSHTDYDNLDLSEDETSSFSRIFAIVRVEVLNRNNDLIFMFSNCRMDRMQVILDAWKSGRDIDMAQNSTLIAKGKDKPSSELLAKLRTEYFFSEHCLTIRSFPSNLES